MPLTGGGASVSATTEESLCKERRKMLAQLAFR
jgi:hypothetical protein